jgi:hypothetical protein
MWGCFYFKRQLLTKKVVGGLMGVGLLFNKIKTYARTQQRAFPILLCSSGVVGGGWTPWVVGGTLLGTVVLVTYPHITHWYSSAGTSIGPDSVVPPEVVVNWGTLHTNICELYPKLLMLSPAGRAKMGPLVMRHQVAYENFIESVDTGAFVETSVFSLKSKLEVYSTYWERLVDIFRIRADLGARLNLVVTLPDGAIRDLPHTQVALPISSYSGLTEGLISPEVGQLILHTSNQFF